jgi:hypothetical protein
LIERHRNTTGLTHVGEDFVGVVVVLVLKGLLFGAGRDEVRRQGHCHHTQKQYPKDQNLELPHGLCLLCSQFFPSLFYFSLSVGGMRTGRVRATDVILLRRIKVKGRHYWVIFLHDVGVISVGMSPKAQKVVVWQCSFNHQTSMTVPGVVVCEVLGDGVFVQYRDRKIFILDLPWASPAKISGGIIFLEGEKDSCQTFFGERK